MLYNDLVIIWFTGVSCAFILTIHSTEKKLYVKNMLWDYCILQQMPADVSNKKFIHSKQQNIASDFSNFSQSILFITYLK